MPTTHQIKNHEQLKYERLKFVWIQYDPFSFVIEHDNIKSVTIIAINMKSNTIIIKIPLKIYNLIKLPNILQWNSLVNHIIKQPYDISYHQSINRF